MSERTTNNLDAEPVDQSRLQRLGLECVKWATTVTTAGLLIGTAYWANSCVSAKDREPSSETSTELRGAGAENSDGFVIDFSRVDN